MNKRLILYSALALLTVPLFTLAIESKNPKAFCERFLGKDEVLACESRISKEKVDWYAATVCNEMKDDTQFWGCLDSIRSVQFNPTQIENCGENKTLSDANRLDCLMKSALPRTPASVKESFQPLKSGK